MSGDLAKLERHKKFFQDLLQYLPPSELIMAETDPPPDLPPSRSFSPSPSQSPAPPDPPSSATEHKRTKIRPGFEGTNIIRKKRKQGIRSVATNTDF
jgi:hypothetical protein